MRPGRASIARLRHGCSCQLLLTPSSTRRVAVPTTHCALDEGAGWGSQRTTPHFYKGARGFATVEDEMKAMRVGYEDKKKSHPKQDLERAVVRKHQHPNRTYRRKVGGSLPRRPDLLDQWGADMPIYPDYQDGRVPGERIAGTTPAIEMAPWIPKPIEEQHSSPHMERVMRALQKCDPIAVSRAFIRWTNDLAIALKHHHVAYRNNFNSDHGINFTGQHILREAQALPQSTMSDIFRMMDPLDNPNLDIARDLHFTSGNTHYIDLNDVMTGFGIRSYHEAMHEAVLTMIAVRVISPETNVLGKGSLLPADFQVALRWAGMASDSKDASFIWSAMGEPALHPYRKTSSSVWKEFLRARFAMDPQFHQFDRAKVISHPRHFNPADDLLPLDLLKITDRDRFVESTFENEPWHRSKNDMTVMLSRTRTARHGTGSFAEHFRRERLYPHTMTQDLLCTAIIGFSRAGMIDVVRDGLLWDYLDVQVYMNDDEDVAFIRGGRNFDASDELRPTEQLLDAVVAGLGSAGHVNLAIRLVDFLSERYDIPIPRAVWSELLQWLYMHTTKRRQAIHDFITARPKLEPARKKIGDVEMTYGRAMILEIFKLMKSEPYDVEPSLEDWQIVMKIYASEEHVEAAEYSLEILRDKFIPRYDELVEEYKLAVADEVLWNSAITARVPRHDEDKSASSSPRDGKRGKSQKHIPDPSPERLRLRLQLDHLYNTISGRIASIIKGRYREDDPAAVQNFERITIPNIILEFQRFLPRELHIQLRHGSALLDRHKYERPWWKVQPSRNSERALLPVKASFFDASWTQQAGVEWTTAEGATVEESRPSPADRSRKSRGVGARMPWVDEERRWQDRGMTVSAKKNWRQRHLRELYLAS